MSLKHVLGLLRRGVRVLWNDSSTGNRFDPDPADRPTTHLGPTLVGIWTGEEGGYIVGTHPKVEWTLSTRRRSGMVEPATGRTKRP